MFGLNEMTFNLLLYIAAFGVVWIGSGLVLNPVVIIAKSWKLPAFALSFFLLGVLTSLPEIFIGTSALLEGRPGIFVGNMLGGVIVLMLLIIPLLGLSSGGVRMPRALSRQELILILLVIAAPTLLTSDLRLETWEGLLLVALYLLLFLFVSDKTSLLEKFKLSLARKPQHMTFLIFKAIVGIVLLYLASHQIISSTLFFAQELQIEPFFVSLIAISLGTNIPEFSIIIRSLLIKQKDIALADYLGSASANTVILGILVISHGQPIILPNHFLQRVAFLLIGLVLFYAFSRTKNVLTRVECAILLAGYLVFLGYELLMLS